ncbi:MAG TPA: STAS-like domain-containing protein [Chthoniobacterales bacterium]
MKLELQLTEDFGTLLSDGSRALEYRIARIDPYLTLCEEIVIDFTGVRHANSSFVNALVAGVIEQHGEAALRLLVFKGCNPAIKVLIEAAIDLGLQKVADKMCA